MNIKRYKSHLTISSDDKNNKEKQKAKQNLSNVEKYITKLILISIRTKKILEKHDYFYKAEKRRKFDLKNLKIKPTPFQKYQRFKNEKFLTLEKQNNDINNYKRILTSYPNTNRERKNKINKNLISINHYDLKKLRKNKTHNNNQIFHRTQNNFFSGSKVLNIFPLQKEYNDNFKSLKSKRKHIKKSNKIIQTAEQNKRSRVKIFSALDKFPILNIFSRNSKLSENLFVSKSGKRRERKKIKIHVNNFEDVKFNNFFD